MGEDVVYLLGVVPYATGIEVRRPDVGVHDTNPDQVSNHFRRDRARLEIVRQVAGEDPQPLVRPSLTRVSIERVAPLKNQRPDLAQHLDELAEVRRHSGSASCQPSRPRGSMRSPM